MPTSDQEAKFQLAMFSNDIPVAYELAILFRQKEKWYQLSKVAHANKRMDMAQYCHDHWTGHVTGKMLK
jgi:hypothetical protein